MISRPGSEPRAETHFSSAAENSAEISRLTTVTQDYDTACCVDVGEVNSKHVNVPNSKLAEQVKHHGIAQTVNARVQQCGLQCGAGLVVSYWCAASAKAGSGN